MSDSPSPLPAGNHSSPTYQPQSAQRIRMLVLVGLLVLMIGALWYDYKIARPAVVDAYERIQKLNNSINSRGGKQFMTNKDVQTELNRAPFETYNEGGYMVEVYGWRSGLPTRQHKYFAVYTEAAPYIFLKQYMNEIDKAELKRMPVTVEIADSDVGIDVGKSAPAADQPVAGVEKKKGKRKKDDSGETGPAPAPSAKESAAPSDSADSQSKAPAAAAKEEAAPAKETSAAESTQPKG